MEMDVPRLIHNTALRGTNTSTTNRIRGGGGREAGGRVNRVRLDGAGRCL